MEQSTGTILYEHNSHEQLKPASVTKVMTILLIMEALDNGIISLDDRVACSEEASKMGGSQIWLDTTETLTVNEMLKAICVVSANDASVAMAEHISGSQELFVEKMNARAKELGMNDTCFKNCLKYAHKGDVAKQLLVNKGTTDIVEVIFESDAGSLIPKGQSANIITTVSLPESLNAPINKGDKLR